MFRLIRLRTRLRQGKIYSIEKIEQSLNNFFRKGNLATLREFALRQVALHQSVQDHEYREREGLEQAVIPEKVMICMASRGSAKKLLRVAARIVGRHAYRDWFAVYVETPDEESGRIAPEAYAMLQENIKFAENLGATVVKLKSASVTRRAFEIRPRKRNHARYFRTIGAFALANNLERLNHQPFPARSKRCRRSRYSVGKIIVLIPNTRENRIVPISLKNNT